MKRATKMTAVLIFLLALTVALAPCICRSEAQAAPGDFLFQISGQFQDTTGVAVDSSGNLYVSDSITNYSTNIFSYTIFKFDPNGTLLTKWTGVGDGQNYDPSDIAVNACGSVYLTDSYVDRTLKFSNSGQYQTQWGVPMIPYPILPYYTPVAVGADKSCNVYVIDYHNSQIVKFDSSGSYLALWDRNGLQWPYGIAFDAGGFAYVADTYNNRVVKLDSTGKLVSQWGGTGTGNGQLQRPYGIAVDGNGNVYVADTDNNRIQVFTDSGTYLGQWGSLGEGPGQFSFADRVATNDAGTLVYVTDNERVQVFVGYGTHYTLSYTAGAGGSISGAAKQTVLSGRSGSQVTAVANSGYHFVSWSDGVTSAARTDTNVTANLSVTANFASNQVTYTLNFKAGSGGRISGVTPQYLSPGGKSSPVTAAPNTGYHFVRWTGDGRFVTTTDNPLTVKNVQASQNITANFAINQYLILFVAGNHGDIIGDQHQMVNYGGSTTTVTAVPDRGHRFVNWTDASNHVVGCSATLKLTNVTAGRVITANFR